MYKNRCGGSAESAIARYFERGVLSFAGAVRKSTIFRQAGILECKKAYCVKASLGGYGNACGCWGYWVRWKTRPYRLIVMHLDRAALVGREVVLRSNAVSEELAVKKTITLGSPGPDEGIRLCAVRFFIYLRDEML